MAAHGALNTVSPQQVDAEQSSVGYTFIVAWGGLPPQWRAALTQHCFRLHNEEDISI